MSGHSQSLGSLEVALSHAARLLPAQPALAAEQAAEILKVVPDHPVAMLLLAVAHRSCGDPGAALEGLQQLCLKQPRWAEAHYELGTTLESMGRGDAAIAALRRAVALKPDMPAAWRLLADHLDASGDTQGADEARARFIKSANRDPRLMAAAAALVENKLPQAEALLRAHLKQHETDVAALRMLAEVAARLRRYLDAQALLERCLELAPGFDAARHNYATVLFRQAKAAQALPHVQQLLAKEPRNPGYRNLKAAILAHLGDYAESIEIFQSVLAQYPQQSKIWLSYGHALKTAGRFDDSVAAYRCAIDLEPTLGEAYWSLANLKTFRFADADVGAIRRALARTDLSDDDRLHFEYAFGKALEDAAAYQESFAHYSAGAAIRRKQHGYSAAESEAHVRRSKALFVPEFLHARAGAGAGAADPIFILGLPRAGSTLIEQILASHSLVEGTMELYPQSVAALSAPDLRALGERYLADTRVQRKTDAPFFIDKMPNNWLHVGLIHLILPNAKIIDARRHPLGCCFSNFKQQFARGQNFSYALEDLGRYYRDYVELMAHFDAVLPGRVHRVFYERMIEDTEGEVRRLLDYCGLPFEERCLRFHQNERAVRTASSEQVRQPIYREGMDHWKHYEPWLGPLKDALGPVLELYPALLDWADCLDHVDVKQIQP